MEAEFSVSEDVASHGVCHHNIAHGEHHSVRWCDPVVVEHYDRESVGRDGNTVQVEKD
jgi:hypothetical protein